MCSVIDQVDTIITPPAVMPMTIAYAKTHLKSLTDAEDVLIASWIEAARQYVEEQTGRTLITTEYETWMDAFPYATSIGIDNRIELPHPPLQSVVSVQYVDGSGDVHPVSDEGSPEVLGYSVTAPSGPYAGRGWIEPLAGTTWPTARDERGSVRIRYLAGYGDDPHDVPALLTSVLCFLVAHFDQVRAAVHNVQRGQMIELPFGVTAMLDGFKYSALPSRVHRSDYSAVWR